MGHAYTPGLKVTDRILVTKKRILPLKGEVLVKVGDKVGSETVVARTHLPGAVEPVNVANILGVPPEDVIHYMLKKEDEKVKEGEVIAKSKTFFGLFTSECKCKSEGTIENISHITGQVLIRGNPQPVEIKAYLNGEVVEVYPEEGVAVSTWGSFIHGIFGIGGETHGKIKMVSQDNTSVLTEKEIDKDCAGCVLIGGSLVTADAIKKAISIGAKGVVGGGFGDRELRDFLGYDLGVAITGSEDLGITLVITEGFGQINMAERTFALLKSKEGQEACINGATQIRAGVIRPEVVIPVEEDVHQRSETEAFENIGLETGKPIRVIREPHFGRLGKVVGLPAPLQKLESESHARVLEVEFEDKTKAIIPRANVELIEE